jgi:hypothetical protein
MGLPLNARNLTSEGGSDDNAILGKGRPTLVQRDGDRLRLSGSGSGDDRASNGKSGDGDGSDHCYSRQLTQWSRLKRVVVFRAAARCVLYLHPLPTRIYAFVPVASGAHGALHGACQTHPQLSKSKRNDEDNSRVKGVSCQISAQRRMAKEQK